MTFGPSVDKQLEEDQVEKQEPVSLDLDERSSGKEQAGVKNFSSNMFLMNVMACKPRVLATNTASAKNLSYCNGHRPKEQAKHRLSLKLATKAL